MQVLIKSKKLYRKITRHRFIFSASIVALLALGLTIGASAFTGSKTHNLAFASCTAPSTSEGTDTFSNVTAPATGTYYVWTRMQAPNSSPASYDLEVNGDCADTEGGAALTPNTWTWVNYVSGTTTPTTVTLTAGTPVTVELVGVSAGLEVDNLIFTPESPSQCTPTGDGSNCLSAPASLTATTTAPTNDTDVSGNVAFNVSVANPTNGIASVVFYYGSTVIGTVNSPSSDNVSYNWNTTQIANGTYNIDAVVTDGAGNTATTPVTSVTINNIVAPLTIAITSPAYGSTISGTVPINFTVSNPTNGISKVQIFYGSIVAIATVNPSSDTFTYNWNTTGVPNGTYPLYAVVTDGAGNQSTANSISVTINNATAAFSAAMTSPTNGSTISGTQALNFTVSNPVGGITKVDILYGYLLGVATINPSSDSFSYNWNTTAIKNGTYDVFAVVFDGAGQSVLTPIIDVTIDNVSAAFSASITSPTNGATISGASVPLSFAVSNPVGGITKVDILYSYLVGVATINPSSDTFTYNWNTTGIANGTYDVFAVVFDGAGQSVLTPIIDVTINNNQSGFSADITSPSNGATVSGTVPLQFIVNNPTGWGTAKIDYGYLVPVATIPFNDYIFTYDWDTTKVKNGTYSVYAALTDGAGQTTVTPVITLTVDNP